MRDRLHNNLRKTLIMTVVAGMLGYAIYESRFLLSGPKLVIFQPEKRAIVSDPLLVIKGEAKNLSSLAINGRPILITPEGLFDDKLLLLDGHNTIEVKAKNKFGQENSQILEVSLKPQS